MTDRTTRQDTDGAPTVDRQDADSPSTVSVAQAAQLLGVTPDAIRSRLHRGTLEGEKVENVWRVRLPAEDIPKPFGI